jgi:hypothetical protein
MALKRPYQQRHYNALGTQSDKLCEKASSARSAGSVISCYQGFVFKLPAATAVAVVS